MIYCALHRLGVVAAVLLGCLPGLIGIAAQPATKNDQFNGKVVPLAGLLEKHGAKLDPDAASQWMALLSDDGKVYPLVKDDITRMFFKDKSLQNRPMRLTGRLIADSQILLVVNVQSYLKGQLHDVYYWCETCTIRALEPGDCACCGAVLELREVPLR
jgi:hypothetical protein